MVAAGFLENPEVRRWLNGVEPAWTMLEFNSLNALRSRALGYQRRDPPGTPPYQRGNRRVCGYGQTAAPTSTSSRDRWIEANRDRQPVPRLGRGDVRDHAM